MDSHKFMTWIFIVMLCLDLGSSYKILVAIVTTGTSHYNQGKSIADILHERGHEVTFLSGYQKKKLPYREIVIPEIALDDYEMDFENSKRSYIRKFQYVNELEYFVKMMVNNAMSSENLHAFLNKKEEKFDLVILDYLLNEAFFVLGVRYNCPLILLSPAPMLNTLARSTGNPISPATIPNVFLDFSADMPLWQRIFNTAMTIQLDIHDIFVYDGFHENAYITHFPEEARRVPFSELKRRVSLVLSNTHPALGFPRPYLPNIVEIGGFHIGKVEPLPKEYSDILDNAKDGVIFFSMGSYLKTHTMPKRIRDILLKSLSKLKQTVLWKFETELEGLPKNVIIKKWMPQTSILAHPNVKLFISHGGVLSITEAALSGIPLIMFPVFADQHYNSKIIETANTGITLTFDKLTESSFDALLDEMLNNKTYYENAKRLQKVYLDRPISPRDTINYYVEHVIRTGGAKHLSAPHLDLISSLLLDVAIVLLVPSILISLMLFWVCKKLCFSKKPIVASNKKRN